MPFFTAIALWLIILLVGGGPPCLVVATPPIGGVQYVALESFSNQGMIYVQCFRGNSIAAFKPKYCCEALRNAVEANPTLLAPQIIVHNNQPDFFQKCLEQTTKFPAYDKDSTTIVLPNHSFWYRVPNATKVSVSWFPSILPIVHAESERFVWDNLARRYLIRDEYSVIRKWQWFYDDINTSDNREVSSVRVYLESELSDRGGMHRDLMHRITVEELGEISSLSMIMALHIPADVFVNVDDLFRVEIHGVTVRLVTLDVVIDQEEPAFASIPHGLLVEVNIDTTAPRIFEFITKIHIRYPMPLASFEANSAYRLVTIPPPFLLSALHTSKHARTSIQIHGNSKQLPLQLWVAAGYQDDYQLALFITVVVAMVGAAVMLLDISRVSIWDCVA